MNTFLEYWDKAMLHIRNTAWWETCVTIQQILKQYDIEEPIPTIAKLLKEMPQGITFVTDVGNHEFWVSRAYALANATHRILYSRSFGTLGGALPKAIGAYYQTKRPVVCIIGDQGVQFNLQELQTVAMGQLPILVVICNNHASGMIRDRQIQRYSGHCIHTTTESGYGTPKFSVLAKGYGIETARIETFSAKAWYSYPFPLLLELDVSMDTTLQPFLPKGAPCQDMAPPLERTLYHWLESM